MVFQNKGEQNFHIFYYLLIGLQAQNDRYFLIYDSGEPIRFDYLNEFDYEKYKDEIFIKEQNEKFDELINAMNYVAFMESVIL